MFGNWIMLELESQLHPFLNVWSRMSHLTSVIHLSKQVDEALINA